MAEAPRYVHRPFAFPREEFPRDSNGLVRIDTYAEYLIDNPDNVPLDVRTGSQLVNDEDFMYQHLYFQRPFYRQRGVSKYLRDRVLVDFCESPYNKLAMRRNMEQLVHLRFVEHVIAPDPEAMQMSLDDFAKIDRLGAAAVGRRVALAPEALGHLVPSSGLPRKRSEHSPLERARFFDNEIENALEELESPLITPQAVITSAVVRISKLINNEVLEKEADKRVVKEGTYYPIQIRHPAFYYKMSDEMLTGHNDSKESVVTLRTGLVREAVAA